MQDDISRLFELMRQPADFADVDLSDVNACATDSDNALHFAVRKDDLAAARALIDAGIDINKAADLGRRGCPSIYISPACGQRSHLQSPEGRYGATAGPRSQSLVEVQNRATEARIDRPGSETGFVTCGRDVDASIMAGKEGQPWVVSC